MKKQFKAVAWVFMSWLAMPWIAYADVSMVTSIRPLALIAEELLAPIDSATVTVIVPKNASPHGFSLKPSHLKALLTSPVVLWLGPSFEPYLQKALLKRPNPSDGSVVAAEFAPGIALLASRDVDDRFAAEAHIEEQHSHQRFHHDEHHQAGTYDPHLWWSSDNAVQIAMALTHALSQQFPEYQQALTKSLSVFTQRLIDLKYSHQHEKPLGKASFVVYHDSLMYLEKELERSSIRRIAVSPEAKPSIKDMLALKVLMNRNKVNCIILEPGASQKFLEKVNPDHTIKEVMIDPLGWDANSYSIMWQQAATQLIDCSLP